MSNTSGFLRVVDEAKCRGCGATGMSVFYEQHDVPVHSVLLMSDRDTALDYPRGDIVLGFCRACGFVSNLAFDPTRLESGTVFRQTRQIMQPSNGLDDSLP